MHSNSNQSNGYTVIKFGTSPRSDGDDIVCVPNSWLQVCNKEHQKVALLYPNETAELIETLVKNFADVSPDWSVHLAENIKQFKDYKNAIAFVERRKEKLFGNSGSDTVILVSDDEDNSQTPVESQNDALVLNLNKLSAQSSSRNARYSSDKTKKRSLPAECKGNDNVVAAKITHNRRQTLDETMIQFVCDAAIPTSSTAETRRRANAITDKVSPKTSSSQNNETNQSSAINDTNILEFSKHFITLMNRWFEATQALTNKIDDLEETVTRFIQENRNTQEDKNKKHQTSSSKLRSSALPSGCVQKNSRWTLRFQKRDPQHGIYEIIPDSGVYVSITGLNKCCVTSKDLRALSRNVAEEIFTEEALCSCTLSELDRDGVKALLDFVIKRALNEKWITNQEDQFDDTIKVIKKAISKKIWYSKQQQQKASEK